MTEVLDLVLPQATDLSEGAAASAANSRSRRTIEGSCFTIFSDEEELQLDGCICLNVTFGDDDFPRRILLGLRADQGAFSQHQAKIESLAKAMKDQPAMKDWLEAHNISEVVTVYVGPNALSDAAAVEFPHASTLGELCAGEANGVFDRFKHRCYIHHEDIRRWCPSVAYAGCDARTLPRQVASDAVPQRVVVAGGPTTDADQSAPT